MALVQFLLTTFLLRQAILGHLFVILPYLPCRFRTAGHVQPEDVSHASCYCRSMGHLPVGLCFLCHFCMVAHSSPGGGQSSLAPIISLGPFLLISLVSAPAPFLPRFSDRYYFGILLGDLFFLCRLRFPVRRGWLLI
jgi:hypothetical protein